MCYWTKISPWYQQSEVFSLLPKVPEILSFSSTFHVLETYDGGGKNPINMSGQLVHANVGVTKRYYSLLFFPTAKKAQSHLVVTTNHHSTSSAFELCLQSWRSHGSKLCVPATRPNVSHFCGLKNSSIKAWGSQTTSIEALESQTQHENNRFLVKAKFKLFSRQTSPHQNVKHLVGYFYSYL